MISNGYLIMYRDRERKNQYTWPVVLSLIIVSCSISVSSAVAGYSGLSPSAVVPMRLAERDVAPYLMPGFAPSRLPKPHQRSKKKSRTEVLDISLDRAIHMAEKEFGGKALSAKIIQGAGPTVFKVKLLSEAGRVHVVFVDAETGDVFKTR